jgi:CheY-like chemotaxis protein/two-component sensor histidine kinase
MLSWTSILRSGKPDPDLLAQGLEVIARSANAQKRLIDDLLEVSRIVTNKLRLELRAVSLQQVVEGAVEAARPVGAAKDVRLFADLTPESVMVMGDPDRLEQVLNNLLANALKFTPAHGEVHVQLARLGGLAEIRVRDSGEGIPPEFLSHIFERFRQADSTSSRPHGGLGIGLAIVRHLVELHAGSVRAESSGIGKGATFVVELPLAAASEVEHRAEPGEGVKPTDASLAGLNILLVEDMEDARESLALLLRHKGAAVVAVGSAGEAIEALDRGCPDVLLSDIAMPGRDGLDLIAEVRARADRAAVVPAAAISAYARPEECARALRAGFDRHLSKPLHEATLLSAVLELSRARSA